MERLTVELFERTRPVRNEKGGLIARIKGPVGTTGTGLARPDGSPLLEFRNRDALLNGGRPRYVEVIAPGRSTPEGHRLERVVARVIADTTGCQVQAGAREAMTLDAWSKRAIPSALIFGDRPDQEPGLPEDLIICAAGVNHWLVQGKAGACVGEMRFDEVERAQTPCPRVIMIERLEFSVPRLALVGVCLAAAGILVAK